VTRYDLVFVCDVDIPYDDTWDRSGEVCRAAFQRQVIADLVQRKVPFVMLRGTLEERVARVRDVLGGFHRYMNVADLLRGVPG
jgi:nicotinamide riboside kinase